MSVASQGCRGGGTGIGGGVRVVADSANAAVATAGDLKSIHVRGKVLQRVRIKGRESGIVLCELNHFAEVGGTCC